ncbi:hypothetical protein HNP35_000992 [Flavobacterium notoginsengisoli]|nr:hypothetical protein [Flavobacterium notoginsengisoli]
MLLILALALCSYANAQKGSILVMGSVYYNSENTSEPNSENKNFNLGFAPKIGYQFHENWTAGVESDFYANKQKQSYMDTEYKYNIFSIGGFLRYSKPINQTFSAYADFGVGYQNKKDNFHNEINESVRKGNGMYVDLTPALFIDINKGFGLNFNIGGLGYSTLSYDENNGSADVKRFNFSFGQAFSIGISKNF